MDAFGITLLASNSTDSVPLSITAGSHAAGLSVSINDHVVPIGTVVEFGTGAAMAKLSRPSADHVAITVGDFHIGLTNADDFINIDTRLAMHIVKAGAKRSDMTKIKGYTQTHALKQGTYPDINIHGERHNTNSVHTCHTGQVHVISCLCRVLMCVVAVLCVLRVGLLGQTWRNTVYGAGRVYEGSVDDYVCSAQFMYDSVFSTNNKQSSTAQDQE